MQDTTSVSRATSVFASPTYLFYSTMVLAMALTISIAYIYDRDTRIKGSTYSFGTVAPFPNAYPDVTPPSTSPTKPHCLELCANEIGEMTPCKDTVITPCTSKYDCDTCTNAFDLTLSCQKPSKTVAAEQKALGNPASKYCLVQPKTCAGSTDPLKLTSCNVDMDCAMCDDLGDNPLRETMVCQDVPDDATLSTVTSDGKTGKAIEHVKAGRYCLPKLKKCDYSTGSAVWTSTGWTCMCNKYGNLFGGDDCSNMVACSNNLVTPWSKDKQQLLLAVKGRKNAVGEPWTLDDDVNPLGCHDPKTGGDVACNVSGAKSNTVCQCDGVASGDYATFTYSDSPYQCVPDPCYANAFGGSSVVGGQHTEYMIEEWRVGSHSSVARPSTLVFAELQHELEGNSEHTWSMARLVAVPGAQHAADANAISGKTLLRDTRLSIVHMDDNNVKILVFARTSAQQNTGHGKFYLLGALSTNVLSDPAKPPTDMLVAPVGYSQHPYPSPNQIFQYVDSGKDVKGTALFQLRDKNDNDYLTFVDNAKSKAWPMVKTSATNMRITHTHGITQDIVNMFGQPSTNCMCSGAGATKWHFDKNNIDTNNGYSFAGACEDYTIPHSNVVVKAPATRHKECYPATNMMSRTTALVPGLTTDEKGRMVSTCVPDICRGEYADPYYTSPNYVGTYDAAAGHCLCHGTGTGQETGWNHKAFKTCPARTVNPVCSACVNACTQATGAREPNPCPDYWYAPYRSPVQCTTNTDGNAVCTCRDLDNVAKLNDRYCVLKEKDHGCAAKYYPIRNDQDKTNVCQGGGYKVQKVKTSSGQPCVVKGTTLACWKHENVCGCAGAHQCQSCGHN